MPDLKIYGIAQSRTFRTLWAAMELGLEYEQVELGFGEDGVKSPSFLAINPNGRVPTIQDGDFALWESMAINLYLAKKHDHGLYPHDLQGEAKCWQWSFWTVTEIEQLVTTWATNAFILPEEKRDAAKAADALAQLQRPLGALEKQLTQTAHLIGADFTVADLNLASAMFRVLKMDLAKFPRTKAWLDRCYARPAAVAAVKKRS
jgi:glutathione S-transferase